MDRLMFISVATALIIGFFFGAQYMESTKYSGVVAGALSDPYEYERITIYGDLDTNEVGRDDATLYFYLPGVPLDTYKNIETVMVNIVPHQYLDGEYIVTAKDTIEREYVGFGCYADDQQGLTLGADYTMRRANGAAGPTEIHNYIFTLINKSKIASKNGCMSFAMENLELLRIGTFDVEVSLYEKDNINPTHVGKLTLDIVEKGTNPVSPSPTYIPPSSEVSNSPEPTTTTDQDNFEMEIVRLRERVHTLENQQAETEIQVKENTNLISKIIASIQEFFSNFQIFK